MHSVGVLRGGIQGNHQTLMIDQTSTDSVQRLRSFQERICCTSQESPEPPSVPQPPIPLSSTWSPSSFSNQLKLNGTPCTGYPSFTNQPQLNETPCTGYPSFTHQPQSNINVKPAGPSTSYPSFTYQSQSSSAPSLMSEVESAAAALNVSSIGEYSWMAC